jgi:WD40 repeat protein
MCCPEEMLAITDDRQIWDPRTKDAVNFIETNFPITAIALSEAGNELFTGGIDNDIKVWDLRKQAVSYTLLGHTDTVTSLQLSPDNQTLLSNAHDSTVRTWDIRPFAPADRRMKTYDGAPTGQERNLFKASWDPKGERIVAGSGDGTVAVWESRTGKLLNKLPGHRGAVNDVRFSPNDEPIRKSHLFSIRLVIVSWREIWASFASVIVSSSWRLSRLWRCSRLARSTKIAGCTVPVAEKAAAPESEIFHEAVSLIVFHHDGEADLAYFSGLCVVRSYIDVGRTGEVNAPGGNLAVEIAVQKNPQKAWQETSLHQRELDVPHVARVQPMADIDTPVRHGVLRIRGLSVRPSKVDASRTRTCIYLLRNGTQTVQRRSTTTIVDLTWSTSSSCSSRGIRDVCTRMLENRGGCRRVTGQRASGVLLPSTYQDASIPVHHQHSQSPCLPQHGVLY